MAVLQWMYQVDGAVLQWMYQGEGSSITMDEWMYQVEGGSITMDVPSRGWQYYNGCTKERVAVLQWMRGCTK